MARRSSGVKISRRPIRRPPLRTGRQAITKAVYSVDNSLDSVSLAEEFGQSEFDIAFFDFTDDFFYSTDLHLGSVYVNSSSSSEEFLSSVTTGLAIDFTDSHFISTGHLGSVYLKGNL